MTPGAGKSFQPWAFTGEELGVWALSPQEQRRTLRGFQIQELWVLVREEKGEREREAGGRVSGETWPPQWIPGSNAAAERTQWIGIPKPKILFLRELPLQSIGTNWRQEQDHPRMEWFWWRGQARGPAWGPEWLSKQGKLSLLPYASPTFALPSWTFCRPCSSVLFLVLQAKAKDMAILQGSPRRHRSLQSS